MREAPWGKVSFMKSIELYFKMILKQKRTRALNYDPTLSFGRPKRELECFIRD